MKQFWVLSWKLNVVMCRHMKIKNLKSILSQKNIFDRKWMYTYGYLNLFSIKNVFYDKMDFRFFIFVWRPASWKILEK